MTNFARRFSGISSVGAYQLSGVPYLTSSLAVPSLGNPALEVEFPFVTKFLTVRNTLTSGSNVDLRVGFSSNGVSGTVQNNYFTLAPGESYTGDWRVGRVYLISNNGSQCSASILAGLAPVTSDQLLDVSHGGTRANWSGSIGVG